MHPFITNIDRADDESFSDDGNAAAGNQENSDKQDDIQLRSQSEVAEEQQQAISEPLPLDQGQRLEHPVEHPPGAQYITISVQEHNRLKAKIAELEAQIIQKDQKEALVRDNIRRLIQLLSTRS
jgi:hypothetical protein